MEQIQYDHGPRLKALIKALKLNQTTFAQSLGMTQPNISRMVSGENKISTEVISRITQTYKSVNLHWLLTGDGPMFLSTTQEKSTTVPDGKTAIGKGRLEVLEERVERLEKVVKQLLDEK